MWDLPTLPCKASRIPDARTRAKRMLGALSATTLLLATMQSTSGQVLSVLHIRVVLVDAGEKPTPVPRHALLISDNPPSAVPRRIVTGPDGTADVRLRPGSYTVESDSPVVLNGKSYKWTQLVEITAGQEANLELTADNAKVEPVGSTTTAAVPLENDPAFLLPEWQDSVVAVWTAFTRASGFVVDAKGLVVTNQRVVGDETLVEVQLTPLVKVAARVLVADPARDVAVLWVDPKVTASVRPVPLECAQAARPPVVEGQAIFAIGAPLRGQTGMTPGTVSRVELQAIVSDFRLAPGSLGGPVFSADGRIVGITSVVDETDEASGGDVRVVPTGEACVAVASAAKKTNEAAPPSGTHLPVEPARSFSIDALKDVAEHRAGSLNPYRMTSSHFEIAFITPVLVSAAEYQSARENGRDRSPGAGAREVEQARVPPLTDFANWSEYVADHPPVLLVRVTPRLVEGFWTTVARGAAWTQGVALPPIKRFKPGFSRLQAFCGNVEITPIHPFRLEQRVSESTAIHEGLYVFDPGALGPHCGTVNLVLYTEKEPEKGETRAVDPGVLEQIRRDFAALGHD